MYNRSLCLLGLNNLFLFYYLNLQTASSTVFPYSRLPCSPFTAGSDCPRRSFTSRRSNLGQKAGRNYFSRQQCKQMIQTPIVGHMVVDGDVTGVTFHPVLSVGVSWNWRPTITLPRFVLRTKHRTLLTPAVVRWGRCGRPTPISHQTEKRRSLVSREVES